MKKILLIEDRSQRQNLFSNETKINLNNNPILDNMINEKYDSVLNDLQNDAFILDDYSVIIAHKSAFGDDNIMILKKLENHCRTNKKTLILFSGGIDCNFYLEEEGYIMMEINSKTLYSINIQLFLEGFKKGNNNPLILSYGDRWKSNVLLNVLESINLFIEKTQKDKMLYSVFLRDNPRIELINSLDTEVYQPVIEGNRISKFEIIKLRDNILTHIKGLSNE